MYGQCRSLLSGGRGGSDCGVRDTGKMASHRNHQKSKAVALLFLLAGQNDQKRWVDVAPRRALR